MADVIWQAANESSDRLRFRAGPDAKALLDERKAKGNADFVGSLKGLMDG
ncbi:hypothetical protein [Roseibaca sp. Y0-43]|nr:hypothetical protein [Roseibaca sp. Y0-43]MCC1482723.1 hypothetical protein [Roseibaca sp. Y0-43]